LARKSVVRAPAWLTGTAVVFLCACGGGAGTAGGSGSIQGVQNAAATGTPSNNWSGYALTGSPGGFTQISGTWTVPSPDCTSGAATSSSSWAGIGGYQSADQTLIQAGTEQDCSGGTASYYAWWEGYPQAAQEITTAGSYVVHPGDQVAVNIAVSDLVSWAISIHDVTAGWTYSTNTPFLAAAESAEWIVEAPLNVGSGGVGGSTLSDFGTVPFSNLAANGAAAALSASEAIVMVNGSNNIIAEPSAPLSKGSAFDDCYGSSGCD
jgi:hypothetical protein